MVSPAQVRTQDRSGTLAPFLENVLLPNLRCRYDILRHFHLKICTPDRIRVMAI